MNKDIQSVIYWDASAILSVLFKDNRSDEALEWSQKDSVHLISTLAYAEVCAVITRLKRDRIIADVLVDVSLEALKRGPWRHLNIMPEWNKIKSLSRKWPLRGADLWHLAVGKTLQEQLPELHLLTFDKRLRATAQKERLLS